MAVVEPEEYLEHVRGAGQRIGEVADGIDVTVRVPSCPEYDLNSLLLHTGAFCRNVREALAQNREPEVDWGDVGGDMAAFHRQEHAGLVETLAAADPERPAWSWGSDQRAAFWFRRAAQELAVHRWDAELACTGDPSPIDAHLAVDGVDELLAEFGRDWPYFDRPGAASMFGGDGQTFHLHTLDHETERGHLGEWMVTCRPDHFEVEHVHAKGDVAARGASSDLLLFLWGRVGPDRFEVFGDASLLTRWQERVRL